MTLEDLLAREGIRHTMARYNFSGDRAQVETFVSTFTEDAIYEPPGDRLEGRAAIRAWLTDMTTPKAGSAPSGPARSGAEAQLKPYSRHNITTCLIELDGPDAASVRTYYIFKGHGGRETTGFYIDKFRKVGEDWLIAHRTVRTDE